MDSAEEKPSKRTPKGARLPQVDLLSALPLAEVVAEFAGSITRPVLAQHLKMSPASSSFKNKVAAAKYYGLLEQKGDQISLTARGQRAVDGDVAARREAVLATGFGGLIKLFAARSADADVLSSRLKMDFAVPDGSARALADTLISAGSQVGLVSNGVFDAAAIQGVEKEADSEVNDGQGAEVTSSHPSATNEPPAAAELRKVDPQAQPRAHSRDRAAVHELHIDVQVHISPDSSPELIDQIFSSMAKHLYSTESSE
jgi:hypothetical protein